MQDVLKYQLGPLPWSLATPVGVPAKTAKATLLHLMEGQVDPVEDVPVTAVLIIDGKEIMHSTKTVPKTFSELAKYVFQLIKRTHTIETGSTSTWISILRCRSRIQSTPSERQQAVSK